MTKVLEIRLLDVSLIIVSEDRLLKVACSDTASEWRYFKMTVEQNRAIALRFLTDGWGTHSSRETVWDEVVSPDVLYHFNSEPGPIVGLAENKAFNATLFKGFPEIAHTLQAMVAEGDKVVYRTTLRGAHTGEFLGMPPTGRTAQINDFTMLRIAEGKIAEWWYDCNLLALIQQLKPASDYSC